MPQIFIFGDSIAHGMWSEDGGWSQKFKNQIFKKVVVSDLDEYFAFYNLSIPGDTTQELLKRFEFELKSRPNDAHEYIFVFAIGINDSQTEVSTREPRTSLDQFRKNLEQLLKLSQINSSKTFFVGLTPVDESKTDPIYWQTNIMYTNDLVEKYDQVLKTFCEKNQVPFVDIFQKMKGEDYKGMLADGLHPNAKGHQFIWEKVQGKIRF